MFEQATALLAPIVKRCEGLAKKLPNGLIGPYICPAGYATQGFGLLVADMKVPAITPAEAERRLYAALPYYIRETLKLCPRLWLEDPAILAAISDFCFNLGAGRLRASTLRKRINAGDWPGAIRELRKWVFGGARKLSGLVTRRELEILLILSVIGDIDG